MSSRFRDLTGQRFGRLIAISKQGRNKYDTLWLCICDCGNEKIISRGCLTSKNGTRSCGCLSAPEDLSGRRFGNLLVLSECGRSPDGKVLWNCKCDCGKTAIVRGTYLKTGHTKTCGNCWKNDYHIDFTTNVVYSRTQNGVSFCFDLEEYDKVKTYRWYSNPPQNYIYTIINRKRVTMHQMLLDASDGYYIDHVNRIKTDNRRSNLRLANKQGNSANTGLQKNNKTGAKGVDLTGNKKYNARIGYRKKKINLGTFETLDEAAQAYDEAAQFYFGDFACTNAMIQEGV